MKKYHFRYEGFAIDLADKLAGILHFNHTFRIVADKKVYFFRIFFQNFFLPKIVIAVY